MMSRRKIGWFVAMLAFVLAVTLSAPAFPQDAPDPAEQTPPEAPDTAAAGIEAPPEVSPEGEATVETILRQQEQVLRGRHFSYDPEGRRDPFMSLMTRAVVVDERPPGVAGMLVAELDLAGVVNDGLNGDVAMFIGSDNKGYFLRIGDEVYDGRVIAVDPRQGSVTFRQQVDDPRLIKPYRDVVKRLVPLEESSK
jgi:hypothetical protein